MLNQGRRTVIAEVPSGKVELVMIGGELMTLQFNAKCQDVLHLCHAACCRLRSQYNVSLKRDEQDKFASMMHPLHPGRPELRVLQTSADGHSCIYLNDDHHCAVHADKPHHCGIWHCSPGGQNANGTSPPYRAMGWAMLPFAGEVPVEAVLEANMDITGVGR